MATLINQLTGFTERCYKLLTGSKLQKTENFVRHSKLIFRYPRP